MGFTNVILLNADRWRSDDGGEAVGMSLFSVLGISVLEEWHLCTRDYDSRQ